uniref:NADH dehydrogenase subunit 1 n=1 Tax=Craseoa lathetica TaxID=316205 RepID=UPI0026E146B4|nr:NADH dehydrogenase subunit 1 [Craseoa lathetica]WJJ70145.1 NADH dehydrogenase subunit 1 [Craseoa lathetica]
MKILFLHYIILIIPLLISIAYLTLAERKILGYTQNRKGPNVVGIYGLFQPLSDGVKLFSKEIILPNHVNLLFFLFSPIIALTLALFIFTLLPFEKSTVILNTNYTLLFFFAISALSVFVLLLSGWSSNSKYAFLGALRAAAQMISYEISIGLIVMTIVMICSSFNIININTTQSHSTWLLLPLFPMGILFFVSCLAETNRAPFDLTEGESEIVSGFNVEYSSMSFALFFLAEYAHIIFMSFLMVHLFLGGYPFLFVKSTFIIFFFIWVRTSFPRLRYDQLMHLLWKSYLPLSLSFIFITNTILWLSFGLHY